MVSPPYKNFSFQFKQLWITIKQLNCITLCFSYQIGFFRINQLQGLENQNDGLNNEAPVENNNGIPQEQEPDGLHRGVVIPDPEHPSFIARTWTFVSSFFSSIIPEAQNTI